MLYSTKSTQFSYIYHTFIIGKMCFAAGWNGFAGRILPASRSVKNPDRLLKRSGDSTHHCRSPTPTLNGCDLSPSTETQPSELEYTYLTASKRHPSTPYSHHNTPQSFSRGTQPYTYFTRSTNHVYKSFAYSQDFSNICWRVEICSVMLRPRRKPHWVSSSFGSIIFAASWGTLFLGGLAKRCRGSWFIHSYLRFCVWGSIG